MLPSGVLGKRISTAPLAERGGPEARPAPLTLCHLRAKRVRVGRGRVLLR